MNKKIILFAGEFPTVVAVWKHLSKGNLSFSEKYEIKDIEKINEAAEFFNKNTAIISGIIVSSRTDKPEIQEENKIFIGLVKRLTPTLPIIVSLENIGNREPLMTAGATDYTQKDNILEKIYKTFV